MTFVVGPSRNFFAADESAPFVLVTPCSLSSSASETRERNARAGFVCKARSGRDRAVAGARLGVLLARWLAHARRQDRDVCRRVLQSASAWTRACCRGCSVQRLMSGHMQQQRKLQDQHAHEQSRGERARLCRVAIQTRVCSLVALPLA